jgi:hypothetical protein
MLPAFFIEVIAPISLADRQRDMDAQGNVLLIFWLGKIHAGERGPESLPLLVGSSVTVNAQRNQVLFGIIAGVAAKLLVVDF